VPRITYNKLVRDRIPEIIEAEGRQCRTEVMTDAEYRQALLAKLVEEASEAQTAEPDNLLLELADLYEVLDAIMAACSIDKHAVVELQQARRDERGGFEQRLRLLWVDDSD